MYENKELLSLTPTPAPMVAVYWNEQDDGTISLFADPILYFGLFRVRPKAGESYTDVQPLTLDSEGANGGYGFLYDPSEDDNFLGVGAAGAETTKEWMERAEEAGKRARHRERVNTAKWHGQLATDGTGNWRWQPNAPNSWIAVDRADLSDTSIPAQYLQIRDGQHLSECDQLVRYLNRQKYVFGPLHLGWRRVVTDVMARKALLGSVLQHAVPTHLSDGVLTLKLQASAFHREMLMDQANAAVINEAVQRHVAGAQRFTLVVEGEEA